MNETKELKELKARQERRRQLQREINSYKVNIDRSCWTKTQKEKDELKAAKANYKKTAQWKV